MQGFTKIFNKLVAKKTHLVAQDMTPEMKTSFYSLMMSYGATQGFTYDRLFQQGFAEWEIVGIDNIKKEFLADNDDAIKEAVLNTEDGKTIQNESATISGQLYNMVTMYNEPGAFFAMVSLVRGLRSDFYRYMADKGMKSNATALQRFKTDNWLPWERKGMHAILLEFFEKEW